MILWQSKKITGQLSLGPEMETFCGRAHEQNLFASFLHSSPKKEKKI